MARPPKIRITENDRKEYAKLAKNTKAKIRRTHKNYGIDLRDEISVPDLDSFSTRKEFNEWKEKAGSFTNRNNLNYQFVKNEHNVAISKARLNKDIRETKVLQARYDQQLKSLENKPAKGGRTTHGQLMKQMAKPSIMGTRRPKDFNFGDIKDYRRLHEKEETIKKKLERDYMDKRTKLMQDTYIRELEQAFNSDANDVADLLRNMPADDFYDMYLQEDMDFNLFYLMKYLDEDQQTYELEKIRSYVQKYYDGDTDMSLKDFANKF